MSTRQIRKFDTRNWHKRFRPCQHPEHNPPSMMVYQPGEYEHECPGCSYITSFSVYPSYYLSPNTGPRWNAKQTLRYDISGISSERMKEYINAIENDCFVPFRG